MQNCKPLGNLFLGSNGFCLDKFPFTYFQQKVENGGVNIYFMGDELYASTETDWIKRVDPADLKTFDEEYQWV